MIYSFDLFDTLVTRRVGTPRGVFVYLQQRLLADPQGLPRELCRRFAHERVAAEYAARREAREREPQAAHQVEEVDLAEIYACLGRRHGLTQAAIARLMALELDAEAELLYGVPEMLARFHALVARGERVVLISDMYLRRSDIKRLLDGIDPLLAEAPLYLSSEIKLNKASGRLFRYVAEAEGVALSEIHHIGDNPLSDGVRPRELGCQVTPFASCHLTPDESFGANEDDLGWQFLAGVLRESRLTLDSERARLGAIHAAPVLLPFVHWVITQARTRGCRRLYFLARDGQVLLELARRLGASDLEMRYLYVSRLACRRCVARDYAALVDWILVAHRALSLTDVAYRLSPRPQTLIAGLKAATGLTGSPERPLDPRTRRRLRAQCLSHPELKALILDQSARERAHLLGYLHQEGLTASDPVCLVDVGWSGTIQDTLHILLNDWARTQAGAKPATVRLEGLYWGLMAQARADEASNLKTAFAFQPGRFWRDPTALREIIECFTAADHGSTLGYEWRDGVYHPILNAEGAEIQAWGLSEFRAGIYDFSDRLNRWLTPTEIMALMPHCLARLQYLVAQPSPLLAGSLGDFPYSPDPTGCLRPFAPALGLGEALIYHLSPTARRGTITRWRQGSLVNSAPWVRVLMSSPVTRVCNLLRAMHPRALVRCLPYPALLWLKQRLPSPMLRAARAMLRW
ncbi:MAG: HAD family hydrolase [Thermochromatium sp.]